MDVQYLEATNDGINICNDDALPVLTGDHRPRSRR